MTVKIIDAIFRPLTKFRLILYILLGIFIGLGFTVFRLSNAVSYLSNDPRACINCHVMTSQYSTWLHSSHRERAKCNDCHVPHDNIFREYYFHASDGLRHSFMFTFRLDPQVIKIGNPGKEVVQENCIRCHLHLVEDVNLGNVTYKNSKEGKGHLCWDCHQETPHGRVHSQASTPYTFVPEMNPAFPDWLKYIYEIKN